uniref:Putative ovule protein n=1 Tax=Solanum chacoense TaxID=4108 RepID=A0A0V0IJK0_SOLCH
MTKEVLTPYGVSLWKSIRILWPLLKINTTIRVGNGNKTSFWEDKWLGTTNLKSIFPEMHDLVVNKHVSVAELWTQHG